MNEEVKAADIRSFEKTLGELKKPFLDTTDSNMGEKNNQDVEDVLKVVGQRMNQLYDIIKSILDNNGKPPQNASLEVNTIYQLFEQRQPGIFNDLGSRLEVKENMIGLLNRLLKEYPYTPSSDHIVTLKSHYIQPNHIIVPNKQ